MEKITNILKVDNFEELKQFCWSGATQTLEAIEEKGLENEFVDLLNSILEENENGLEETQLNDVIWFDVDYIEECLNVKLWDE